MEQVFAEEKGYSVQHVFMPAIIYYYTQNIYQFFTIIFLFESFEYLFGQLDPYWVEIPGDSLVGDILMAILGMLAIRQFGYEQKPRWYIALHVAVLVVASGMTIFFLRNDTVGAYIFYGSVVSIMGLLISINWAAFSAVNILIIAAIATRGFTQSFSHTPVAVIISLLGTTALILAYKRCIGEPFRL